MSSQQPIVETQGLGVTAPDSAAALAPQEGLSPCGSQAEPPAANACALPASLPGHWDTLEGLRMAQDYAGKQRDGLAMGHMSDLALANAQYLASRYDLDLTAFQAAAKERIRWLSVQLALAQAALAQTPGASS